MARRKCCECEEWIKGRIHPKYFPGQLMQIPKFFCEMCWNRLGRPAKETIGQYYKHKQKTNTPNEQGIRRQDNQLL